MEVFCGSCGSEVLMSKYYVRTYKLIGEDGRGRTERMMCGRCPKCNGNLEINIDDATYGRVTVSNSSLDIKMERIVGTDRYMPKRTRWEDVPADLLAKLEEEQRIRNSNGKVDGEAEEVSSTSDNASFK
jgi:hypothetical protein